MAGTIQGGQHFDASFRAEPDRLQHGVTIFAGVFFAGHFGGFMAIHFFFIYEMFVRPLDVSVKDPAAYEALARLFTPLWPALLALFLSHGFSFALNFIARGEYRGATHARSAIQSLPAAPIFFSAAERIARG